MKHARYACIAVLLLSHGAQAGLVTGTLVSGGGIDDVSLTIRTADGKTLNAYCLDNCGDWFQSGKDQDGVSLKRSMQNRKISVEIVQEKNKDRIAGPGTNDKLLFIKRAAILK